MFLGMPKFWFCPNLNHLCPGAQRGLGGGLKMKKICDVILMTILSDVISWRHQNDIIIDILEVLLRYN